MKDIKNETPKSGNKKTLLNTKISSDTAKKMAEISKRIMEKNKEAYKDLATR